MKSLRAIILIFAVVACALAQTTTVTGNFTDLTGDRLNGNCVLQPVGPFSAVAGWRVIGTPVNVSFTAGAFSVSLAPTDSATPGGQYYKVSCAIPAQTISGRVVGPYSYGPRIWLVPTSATPLDISAVETSTTPPQPSWIVLPQQLSGATATSGAGVYGLQVSASGAITGLALCGSGGTSGGSGSLSVSQITQGQVTAITQSQVASIGQ